MWGWGKVTNRAKVDKKRNLMAIVLVHSPISNTSFLPTTMSSSPIGSLIEGEFGTF